MRPFVVFAFLTACQPPHESGDDSASADTDTGPPNDTDVPGSPFGLPPVDDACRARFPAERPDDVTLARLVGTWTGFNGSGGTSTLTLGPDGQYSWVSDAGDYHLRDEAGTWSAIAADGRSALVLGSDAVVPFRLDGETLVVENLDVGPGDLHLNGGVGAASAPRLDPPSPPVAWCAATADRWEPTHPWAEQAQPDALELRPDGSVAASFRTGVVPRAAAGPSGRTTPTSPLASSGG